MHPTFTILNSIDATSNLSLRERNQCIHRVEEIRKRIIEIAEVIGQDRITVNFEAAGITLHISAKITKLRP